MLSPGQILDGKYEILRILGQGGMSTVYLCKNKRLGNLWAVKEVISKWNNKIDFLAEPNILKNLSHIGIVRIIDIFHEDENLYIVEDFIEGKTLKEYIDINGPISSVMAAEISLQICGILNYLHSLNPPIIYRDLKPSNIMIKPDNKVVLIDFGIARTYKEGQEGDTVILGSKGYIAPEQLANVQSNAQTDIYSLGATMFFMLTGKSIGLPTELMFLENYPQDADRNFIKVIQKASAIEPDKRYPEVKQMLSDINAVLAEGRYDITRLMNSHEATVVADAKAAPVKDKKPKKQTKLIIIAVLALIITLAIFLALHMSNKAADKKASDTPAPPKTAESQAPKEVVEKDTVIRGVLDSKKPVVLNSGSSNGKGKGKDKDEDKNIQLQFALNPPATVSNSKLSIALTHIQVIDDDIIAILNIQNPADAALKLDLSKTFLVNGKNETRKSYNPNPTSLLTIPQSSSKQELKLYFRDFNFEGNTYTLKTMLTSSANKDISLFIDIK
jgi:serine/threonine protein kinase